MTRQEQLDAEFERHRPHLQHVAYAVLGSIVEAEDVVQEAWLRLQRQPNLEAIHDLKAWLTTIVGRLALDVLNSARIRREQYIGPWLPEPIVEHVQATAAHAPASRTEDPADRVTLDESISTALLIVLERLSPQERVAFLLHDVFGFTFEQTATVTGRTATGARKLAERARRHVEAGRPRHPPSRAQQLEIVSAFAMACTEGDLERLIGLLDPDVVWRTDGGGKANAARRPHRGAHKVARAMLALASQKPLAGYIAEINGTSGLVIQDPDGPVSVISLTVSAERIVAIDIVRNPDKLTTVPAPEQLPSM